MFTPPMPDETVYSILAAHNRLLPDLGLTTRLFGYSKIQARIDWPVGLEMLSPPRCHPDLNSIQSGCYSNTL